MFLCMAAIVRRLGSRILELWRCIIKHIAESNNFPSFSGTVLHASCVKYPTVITLVAESIFKIQVELG